MFEVNEMIFDNSIWLAIMAINMTIIGLTSLAESKTIIGVDYGKFLVKKYKVLGIVRMYYLLIIFAFINIISLILMFNTFYQARVINFVVLLISLIFAIYYFFGFILTENNEIKLQILKDELLGMYYDSDDLTNFEADILAGMSTGWRTEKRISSNVISYFNTFNSDTQRAFNDAFGTNSILYSRTRRMIRFWNRNYNLKPYNYMIDKDVNHISHEFFQMFRYSELQDKWILEILRLFDSVNCDDKYNFKRINIMRVLAQINRFGKSENLYGYKFIEYLGPYIINALQNSKMKEKQNTLLRIKMDKFIINELYIFILSTIEKYEDKNFYKSSLRLISDLFDLKKDIGKIHINDRLIMIFKLYSNYKCRMGEDFLMDLFYIYECNDIKNKVTSNDLKNIISSSEQNFKKNILKKNLIFCE